MPKELLRSTVCRPRRDRLVSSCGAPALSLHEARVFVGSASVATPDYLTGERLSLRLIASKGQAARQAYKRFNGQGVIGPQRPFADGNDASRDLLGFSDMR